MHALVATWFSMVLAGVGVTGMLAVSSTDAGAAPRTPIKPFRGAGQTGHASRPTGTDTRPSHATLSPKPSKRANFGKALPRRALFSVLDATEAGSDKLRVLGVELHPNRITSFSAGGQVVTGLDLATYSPHVVGLDAAGAGAWTARGILVATHDNKAGAALVVDSAAQSPHGEFALRYRTATGASRDIRARGQFRKAEAIEGTNLVKVQVTAHDPGTNRQLTAAFLVNMDTGKATGPGRGIFYDNLP